MVAARPTAFEVWGWLKEIADPEIPVLSIVDLGMVRYVGWASQDGELSITITPTYSGCPAMEVIAAEIRSSMKEHGIDKLLLQTKLSPAWTTDWMSSDAKERLQAYGIAPPASGLIAISDTALRVRVVNVECPRCGSDSTELVSRFGSTPCKAHYKCRSCLEPFDAFKPH